MNTLTDQFTRLSGRGPTADPRFVLRRAEQDAGVPDTSGRWTESPDAPSVHTADLTFGHRHPSGGRRLSLAAACLLVTTGIVGITLARGRGADSPAIETAPAASAAALAPPSPLTLPIAGNERPTVIVDLPGWRVDSVSAAPVPVEQPSPACPGCGGERIVVASDGPLLSGGLFTAWVVPAASSLLDGFGEEVVLPSGTWRRAAATPETPGAEPRWVTWAVPLGDGPDSPIVVADTRGIPDDLVIETIGALSWQDDLRIGELPDGLRVVEPSPVPAAAEMVVISLTDGEHYVNVQMVNRGVDALFDWQYIVMRDLIGRRWEPREIGGVTVAFDWSFEEYPAWGSAHWVVGDWAFAVDGVHLDEDEFAAAVAALTLVDEATFAAAGGGPAVDVDFTPVAGAGWSTVRRFDRDS